MPTPASTLATLLLGTVAACAQAPAPGAAAAGSAAITMNPSDCNADAARSIIGKAVNAELLASAQELSGARRVRVLRPNDKVTMEFDSGRLNVDVDDNGRVMNVRCG